MSVDSRYDVYFNHLIIKFLLESAVKSDILSSSLITLSECGLQM